MKHFLRTIEHQAPRRLPVQERQTDKGRDAARVAVEMANLLDTLN